MATSRAPCGSIRENNAGSEGTTENTPPVTQVECSRMNPGNAGSRRTADRRPTAARKRPENRTVGDNVINTLRSLPVLITTAGAIARVGALTIVGGAPGGLFELIEQAWLGAAWACVIVGLGLLIFTGRTHTLLIGLSQILVVTLWDLFVEWPMAARLSITVPYALTATCPPALGLVIVIVCWRRFRAISARGRERFLSGWLPGWHRAVLVALILLAIWSAGWGSRLAAMSVIRSMGGTVRTERISVLFSSGPPIRRAVWVEFEEANFSDHQWNQLIRQLRKVAMFDYRLSLGPTNLTRERRRRLMKRLRWCEASVNIHYGGAKPKKEMTASGLPDLEVTQVYLSEGGYLRARVKNSGTARARRLKVAFFTNGRCIGTRFPGDLNSAHERETNSQWLPPGTHVVKVVVDPDNTIPESDETNNSKEFTLFSSGQQPPTDPNQEMTGSGLPDLEVTQVFLNEEGYLRARVKNNGAAQKMEFEVHLFRNGRLAARSKVIVLNSKQEGFASARRLQPGTHVIKVVADPDNMIPESDETNNSMEVTLSAPP